MNAPAAMSRIVESEGHIQLIFGKLVSPADFAAIKDGSQPPWTTDELPGFDELIEDRTGGLIQYRVRLLAWLFAAGRLEMKVAIRPQGMFHQKFGLLEDRLGDVVAFSGSMNETMSALDPRFNSEEITVFRSWVEGKREYVTNHAANFEKLWSGDTGSATIICGIPEAIERGLTLVMDRFPGRPTAEEEDHAVTAGAATSALAGGSPPRVPDTIHGNPFSMRPHQLEALRAWAENGYNGILELATGAGKTITAIYAATKIIEANDGIALVVAVPYRDLADQWCRELAMFNIHALQCYGARGEWEPAARAYLSRNRGDQREFIAVVVVNKTLRTDHFQAFATQLDAERLFFIGDECHRHGAEGFVGKLLPGARFRLGLSATPFHYLDEAKNERLREVYDRTVFQYSLSDAVRDGVLTPYEYIPVPVELTEREAQDYLDLSDQIARTYAAAADNMASPSGERLKALLMRRARLVGAAENKIPALENLLDRQGVEKHSLFYCSDGRTRVDDGDDPHASPAEIKQRYAVAHVLQQRGVRVSPFTSDENPAQRREILRRFKDGETEAMVAIHCLDEGIDVPACRTAYLIASSKNPRQFIQRRGRILRRSPGKEYAKIYDFVVVMPEGTAAISDAATDFLRAELSRVADFARNSRYPASSVKPLLPWLKKYNLEHFAA